MRHRDAITALGIIWFTTLAVYICVPWILPFRTQCVPAFDSDLPMNVNDFLPILAVLAAMTGPIVFTYMFLQQIFTAPQFLIIIFSIYILVILLFSMIFYSIGIIDVSAESADASGVTGNFVDYIYYSAVTFTTLGYGDFRPCVAARLYAAIEAVLGGYLLPFSSAVVLAKVLKNENCRNAVLRPPIVRTQPFPWQHTNTEVD